MAGFEVNLVDLTGLAAVEGLQPDSAGGCCSGDSCGYCCAAYHCAFDFALFPLFPELFLVVKPGSDALCRHSSRWWLRLVFICQV